MKHDVATLGDGLGAKEQKSVLWITPRLVWGLETEVHDHGVVERGVLADGNLWGRLGHSLGLQLPRLKGVS